MRLGFKVVGLLVGASAASLGFASFAAIRVLTDNQEAAVQAQVKRSLRVGLTLTLRHVQTLSNEVARLAEAVDVMDALSGSNGYVPRGLVEVSDPTGRVLARKSLGLREGGDQALATTHNSPLIQRGLRYERHATLDPTPSGIVVRAVAPVLDGSFALRGAVVLSSALDASFAELLKGAVGAQVGFYVGRRPVASTFVTSEGLRLVGFSLPAGLERTLSDGHTRRGQVTFAGGFYEVAIAPLQSIDGVRIGLLAVAVDRQPILEARARTKRTLWGGAGIASVAAMLLAVAFSRALTKPIAQLRQASTAIAQGDLDQRIPRLGHDEIGDLAHAFSVMTEALREKMKRETRFREELADTVRQRTSELEIAKEELELANARLSELAITDGLTGLSNHRHLQERLVHEVERSGRSKLPVSLLMIDVDHFKRYNDERGHPAGDEVLRTLAQLLAEGRRKTDVVARYGGEEFALLFPDAGKDVAVVLAEQIRVRVQARCPTTISIGVATVPGDAGDAASLVRVADEALYQAKRAGRNRVVAYKVFTQEGEKS